MVAYLPSLWALTFVGGGRAFNPDLLTEKISVVAESRAGPATAINAVADIHGRRLAIRDDAPGGTFDRSQPAIGKIGSKLNNLIAESLC